MYFDTLTWTSLIIFIGALIGFIYACLVRSCIDSYPNRNRQSRETRRDKP